MQRMKRALKQHFDSADRRQDEQIKVRSCQSPFPIPTLRIVLKGRSGRFHSRVS